MPDYDLISTINRLSLRQQEVLGLICINMDGGHHPKTLNVLKEKGLITSSPQTLGGRFPVVIQRHRATTAAHLAWCQWCSIGVRKAQASARHSSPTHERGKGT